MLPKKRAAGWFGGEMLSLKDDFDSKKVGGFECLPSVKLTVRS